MSFPNKAAITKRLREFLEDRNWCYTDHTEDDVLLWEFSVRGRLRAVSVLAQLYEMGYSVNMLLPISADPDNAEEMAQVLDFLNRINESLREGNFEMDPDDGDLSLRYYVDCEFSEDLPRKRIQKSIFLPMEILERYAEGFAQVLLNHTKGEEAFRLCRKRQAEKEAADNLRQESPEEDGPCPEPENAESLPEDPEPDFDPFADPDFDFFAYAQADCPEEEPEEPEDPEEARFRSLSREMDTLLERLRQEYPEE